MEKNSVSDSSYKIYTGEISLFLKESFLIDLSINERKIRPFTTHLSEKIRLLTFARIGQFE